jgi:hypothetical protein
MDQNCLDHGLDPGIQLWISRNMVKYLHYFSPELYNVARHNVMTPAHMLIAGAAIV